MLSLAYRIATMPIMYGCDDDCGWDLEYMRRIGEMINDTKQSIKTCPKINLDNVCSYYSEHSKTKFDFRTDVPNWAPPFKVLWSEWVTNHPASVGIFLRSTDVDDMGWKIDSIMYWASPLSKWKPCTAGVVRLFVLKNGQYWDIGGRCIADKDDKEDSFNAWGILGLGISFMHCKNVRQVESKDESGNERFRKQNKVPKFRYRTLVIDPMKEVLRTEGRMDRLTACTAHLPWSLRHIH